MGDLLSDEEIADAMPEGWERDGDEIVRTFTFEEYMHGLTFAQTVAEIAEVQFHHPTMVLGYEEVEVRFKSHEDGGITDQDVEMAEFVNMEA